ncbi:MAG: cysteine peptidase family C39 domain-containing protein, partial [Ktedonobacteraceae bacterium]
LGLEEMPPTMSAHSREVIWRSEKACGLNCLYVLLGIHDIPLDYERLTTEMMEEERKYTSLTHLKLMAKKYGLTASIGKTDPSGLMSLSKPIVAHWDIMSQKGESPGHFVLVLKTDSENIEFMDGTSGVLRSISWREFQRRWSGYVMFASRADPFSSWIFPSLSILGGAFIGAFLDRYMLRKTVSKKSSPATTIRSHQ